MMPAMAAAYETLDARGRAARDDRAQRRPSASAARSGTAVLAVVLRAPDRRASSPARAGDAGRAAAVRGGGGASPSRWRARSAHTFWWALGLTALALIPATFLPRHPAVARRPPRSSPNPQPRRVRPSEADKLDARL